MNMLKDTPKASATPELLNTDIGDIMEAKAKAFALVLDADKTGGSLTDIINKGIRGKQDYEGSPFEVLFKVRAGMTAEQWAELPNPGSETGNQPAKYKVRGKPNAKGIASLVEHNYYNVLSDNLPGNVAKQQRIDALTLSVEGDQTKINQDAIPQDIRDMQITYRHAEISRLGSELTTSRTNINAAFELMFAIHAANVLPGITVDVIYALNSKGEMMDGKDGSPVVVENTKTPILVTTTVEGRKAIDVARLSVSSFKRLRPNVAKDNGGTYKAFIESAPKKGTNKNTGNTGDTSKPQAINTLELFETRLVDVHDYIDVIVSDSKQEMYGALLKRLNQKAGNEDLLVSITEIRDMFTALLNKTHQAGPRYQNIITAEGYEGSARKTKTAA